MRRLSPETIEMLYYSPVGKLLVKVHEINHTGDRKVYSILGGLAQMSLSQRAYGERAIIYDAFEPQITKYFLSVINEGDTVYDVGSWIGYYSILAAAAKAGEVVAIEIDSENIERLAENAKLNNFENITIIQVAASNKKGLNRVDVSKSSMMRRVAKEGSVVVDTDTIDNIAKKIDVMIMDIEGNELFALEGMQQLLESKALSHLIIEVHPHMIPAPYSDEDLLSLLEAHGYSFQKLSYNGRMVYHLLAVPIDTRPSICST
jgi:FkbM family methyltransferase